MRWIIGDIHGMLRPLEAIISAIAAKDPSPQFLFTGDYVNRGPESRGVIDFLLKLKNARFVRGNHDDIFDYLLRGSCYVSNPPAPDRLLAYRWFIDQGLDQTLLSYGIDEQSLVRLTRRLSSDRLLKALEKVPAEHREFIRTLPAVIEEPDLFVAHAKWDNGIGTDSPDIETQLADDDDLRYLILWGRFSQQEIDEPKAWNRTGYFGHTPVVNYPGSTPQGNVPLRGDRVVLLDTGAALGPAGRLTAFCPETESFIQATPKGDIVTEAK